MTLIREIQHVHIDQQSKPIRDEHLQFVRRLDNDDRVYKLRNNNRKYRERWAVVALRETDRGGVLGSRSRSLQEKMSAEILEREEGGLPAARDHWVLCDIHRLMSLIFV